MLCACVECHLWWVCHIHEVGCLHQNGGITAFTWVLLQSMVCPVLTACFAIADLSGQAFVRADFCSLFHSLNKWSSSLSYIGGWTILTSNLVYHMGTGSLTWTKILLRVVVGQNWVLMSRRARTLLMASDMPLTYGMVVVALGLLACLDWFFYYLV